METLGEVVEILSQSMVLLKISRPVEPNEILKVFGDIQATEIQQKHGLSALRIPKGELRIVAKQEADFYLAEVFRDSIESTRYIEKPSSLLAGLLRPEFVRERVPGPPSAVLGTPSIELEVSRKVQIGDKIGRD